MNPRASFLSQEKIATARLSFRQLIIRGPEDGDRFFEAYGPGNTLQVIERPFERFEDYELLLNIIKQDDPQKFAQIHKGTPYYFMGWLAFDLKNYVKAVFYLDAAIAEDIRKDPIGWQGNPGNQILTLSDSADQVAARMTKHLRELIGLQFSRFNSISKLTGISLDHFIDKFILILVKDTEKHSIITAVYSFILEFGDREKELQLRSSTGGSIEPVLTYLFKGGLIFESLLKHLYPIKDNGDQTKTLGDIYKTNNFKSDFLQNISTSSSSLKDIINSVGTNTDMQTAFNTATKLRNTTGHNLVWDDVFDDVGHFRILYYQLINATLFIVKVKFL